MDLANLVNQWPPVTRVLVIAVGVTSVLVHSSLLDWRHIIFVPAWAFQLPPKIPQLWRLLTSFCLTGKGLGILFDCYFLYTYSSGLERGSTRFSEPGSYLVFMLFVMTGIMVSASAIFGGMIFLSPLILSLAYIFAQDNPNSNVTIFILSFPAKYLPYALLALTLLSSSPEAAWSQLSGLFAAHLYDFLTRIWPTFGGGRNYLTTPASVKRLYLQMSGREITRAYGTGYDNRTRDAAPAANNRWQDNRGPGRRLGGE